jgi:hypothetical protein
LVERLSLHDHEQDSTKIGAFAHQYNLTVLLSVALALAKIGSYLAT